MKKIAALFAALVFAFAIAACDDGNDDATEAPESPAVESPVADETEE